MSWNHVLTISIHCLQQDFGHKIMCDLAVWLFQQTVLDLLIRPFGSEDRELIEEGLPPPMYPGGRDAQTLAIS